MTRYDFSALDRAITEREAHGYIKVLILLLQGSDFRRDSRGSPSGVVDGIHPC
jgi:hypothetical protein